MDDMFSSLWIQWCNFTLDFPATGPSSDNVNFRGNWVKRHFNNSSACHASTFLGNKLTLLALNYHVLIFFPFRSVFEISTRTATSLLLRDSLSLYLSMGNFHGALLPKVLCWAQPCAYVVVCFLQEILKRLSSCLWHYPLDPQPSPDWGW